MTDATPFAEIVLLVAVAATAAVLSSRLSIRVRVPAPLFFLVGAAVAEAVFTHLTPPSERIVERIVTVCLLCILFDGGMHIGRVRFRAAAAPIVTVGVVGTFLTAGAVALLVHVGFDVSWYAALLMGAVISPTDPAVVFSVLGPREVPGRASTILKGESGANDPVGIALVVSLLSAGHLTAGSAAHVAGQFALQMGVGAAGGIAGGVVLLWFMRRVTLPSEGLYPLRTLAFALGLYGAVTILHGSGFLAVFMAGIIVGDERAPFKREIERFHGALASLAEIAAFVVLGLTVDGDRVFASDVWVPAVVIAAALALLIRPLLVGLCLLPARLRRNENAFVLFAGLKGAVPLLLGTTLIGAHVADPARLYAIVVDVVVLSVLIQGSLVPEVATALHLPVHVVEPQPWALGVRLATEPAGVLRITLDERSPVVGRSIGELAALATDPDDFWVHLLVRNGMLVSTLADTRLQVGDELVVTVDPTYRAKVRALLGADDSGPHRTH